MRINRRISLSIALFACCTIFLISVVSASATVLSIDDPLNNGYNRRVYNKCFIIDIFKTDPNTQCIAPAVYTTGNKKKLADMIPKIGMKVIAKTNANAMAEYNKNGDAFYGLYYVNGQLYADGERVKENKPSFFKVDDKKAIKYYPSFCVEKDGGASIRWFSASRLGSSLKDYSSIIGISHALVYNGKSVFDNTVRDKDDGGYVIYNLKNVNDPKSHYSPYCRGNHPYIRTMVGHTPDGSFLLVTTETIMDLTIAARVMEALGCDYAGNLDGSNATQMRIAEGYTPSGVKPGRVTPPFGNSDGYYYGTAICAYVK